MISSFFDDSLTSFSILQTPPSDRVGRVGSDASARAGATCGESESEVEAKHLRVGSASSSWAVGHAWKVRKDVRKVVFM